MADRVRRNRRPMAWLAGIVLASLVAGTAWIGLPCRAGCRSSADRVLVFDESYYVPAARAIAGLHPLNGQRYSSTPRGDDPNAEHPQLVKLAMAGLMEVLGDGPWAWRLISVVSGVLALLGMYALVRAAGGGQGLALCATALMAADNLMIVHGRIGTLDMPALAGMLWTAALYLRGRVVRAGAVLALATCCKLVAPYVLVVLVLLELLDRTPRRGMAALRALALVSVVGAGLALALLAGLDTLAPPFDPGTHHLVGGGVLGHLAHMLSYGAAQRSPHGPQGIASYPWAWLVDSEPIVYLNVVPARPAPGLMQVHPAVHFLGMISPPILLAGLAGLIWNGWALGQGRRPTVRGVHALAPAWFLGTFTPFLALSLIWQRTSYLYYMLVVMPGLYLAGAWVCLWLAGLHRRVAGAFGAAVLIAAVLMYPFTPLP